MKMSEQGDVPVESEDTPTEPVPDESVPVEPEGGDSPPEDH